eukprot:6693951-Alexandrium_andersonii.AAC.1
MRARRVDRPAAYGGISGWQPRSSHDAPLPTRLERPPLRARREDGLAVAGEWMPPRAAPCKGVPR